MGDNDFTAGDPWGLPIEESEEIEIERARDETDAGLTTPDLEDGADEEAEPDSSLAGEDESSDDYEAREPAGDGETTLEEDSGWAPDSGAFTPLTAADDDVVPVDVPDDEGLGDAWAPIADQASELDHGDDEEVLRESSDSAEDENEYTPPARTPLSQMIAAAQSVVSPDQQDQTGDADESTETEPSLDQPPDVVEEDVSVSEDADPGFVADEAAGAPLFGTTDTSEGDDDLPDEPPAWMIVDPQPEASPQDAAAEGPDIESPVDDEPEFTPMDIEASIADLATPQVPEVPFAEDQFEMPGTEEPERDDDFGDVDMDSAPGVYSELHDLADQDERAEAMLQEAAEAFGRVDEPAEELEVQDLEPAQELIEELADDEDLDHYADALATDLGTVEPAEELEVQDLEPAQEFIEELADDEDLDHYADALATDLGTDLGTVEPAEEPAQELIEELADDEDLDHYADALATDLGTDEPAEELEVQDLEPAQELIEELADDKDLDHYADALATDLGTVEPAEELEVQDLEPAQELIEEPADDEDLDHYADALATDLGTVEPAEASFEAEPADPIDADPEEHLTDDELGTALAGLAEAPEEESPDVLEDAGPVAVGWWDTDSDDVEEAAVVSSTEESEEAQLGSTTEEPIEAAGVVGWWGAESDPPVTASDDTADAAGITEDRIDEVAVTGVDKADQLDEGEDELSDAVDKQPLAPDPAALIDSPVEWGTRYREAHQGWVEDEAGRSTWRPIVTSGESVAGWDIDIYLGLVSGDVSIDPMPQEEIASEVAGAREGAVRRMLDEGLARGAHAVVGVTFSIEEVGGVVLVGASGVAVTLRTPA